MNRKGMKRLIVILLAMSVLGTVGCTQWLAAVGAGSFAAGWLAQGALSLPTTTCYRNGELVDCGTLPTGITQ